MELSASDMPTLGLGDRAPVRSWLWLQVTIAKSISDSSAVSS
jgi:hypothetical protein